MTCAKLRTKTRTSISRNLVPRALFPGFGGGAGPTSKAREKRPRDEVKFLEKFAA